MFKREKQIKYFKKRSKSLLKNFEAFLISEDPETLHKLRVDIKKIKALLVFADDCRNSSIIKDFKGIKKVFKAAGDIRSPWIHLEMMKKNHVNNPVLYKQNHKEFEDSTFAFFMVAHYYRKKLKTSITKIQDHLKDIDDTCILNEYNKRLALLRDIFQKEHLADHLHESRKIIKNLLYTYEVLPESLARKTLINIAWFKNLEEAIGKWHDSDLAMEMLDTNKKSTTVQKIKKNTQTMLNRVEKEIKDFEKKSLSIS